MMEAHFCTQIPFGFSICTRSDELTITIELSEFHVVFCVLFFIQPRSADFSRYSGDTFRGKWVFISQVSLDELMNNSVEMIHLPFLSPAFRL